MTFAAKILTVLRLANCSIERSNYSQSLLILEGFIPNPLSLPTLSRDRVIAAGGLIFIGLMTPLVAIDRGSARINTDWLLFLDSIPKIGSHVQKEEGLILYFCCRVNKICRCGH